MAAQLQRLRARAHCDERCSARYLLQVYRYRDEPRHYYSPRVRVADNGMIVLA